MFSHHGFHSSGPRTGPEQLRRVIGISALLLMTGLFLSAQDTTNRLELFNKMDQGSGTSLVDSSGNGRTGNLYGGVSWTIGLSGKGLSFTSNGSSPNVQASLNGGIMQSGSESSNWTVAIWFRTDRCNGNSTGYLWGRYGWHGGLTLASNGSSPKLTYSMVLSSTANVSMSCTNAMLDNAWHLAAVTYSNRTAQLYLDGVLRAQTNLGATDLFYNHSATLYAGSMTGTYASPFLGSLDELRAYSRALSLVDIQSLLSPAAAWTNLPASGFIALGTTLRGTCTANPAATRLTISNQGGEVTNLPLNLDGIGGWTASPNLPLGDYSAVVWASNAGGQSAVQIVSNFTVTVFSTLTLQSVDTTGAPLSNARIQTPFGLCTNDATGTVTLASIPVGYALTLTNLAPTHYGWTAASTNLAMPASNVSIQWIVRMPFFSTLTVRTLDMGGSAVPGRVFGPGGLSGLRTNDLSGTVTYTGMMEGNLLAFTNFPSSTAGSFLVTNLVMPASNTTLTWILPASGSVSNPATVPSSPALWIPGRPMALPIEIRETSTLTVNLIPLAGGRKTELYQGTVTPDQGALPMALESLRLTPGIYVLEIKQRRMDLDEHSGITMRKMLLVGR